MTSSFQLEAAIETPYSQHFLCPWDVAPFLPGSWLRLSGEMTSGEIGLVFAELAQYNSLDLSQSRPEVLQQVIDAERLILPGGLQAICGDKLIQPGCCCGLETWREWQAFLQTGQSPWLGHDPSPLVEFHGDLIRIRSAGGLGESVQNAFHFDVSRADFQIALIAAERDIQAFLVVVDLWANGLGFSKSQELCQKIDRSFKIGTR